MKNKNREILYFIGIFTFYVLILFLCPIAGDDWGNYLVGQSGIKHIVENTLKLYTTWEGRLISRFLIDIFSYHKILWNIVNALFITAIPYFITKIINPKNKLITYSLILLSLITMNIYTFSQTIVWIAGNVTYLLVIPIILLYIHFLYEKKTSKYKPLFILLNVITPMFIEHMAIILVLINIYFIIKDYLKNKKINTELLVYLIISIVSTTSMLLSPGNRYRSKTEDTEFAKLFILEKIIKNIPNFINYTYIINSSLLLMFIVSNYLLIKKYIKNNIIKITLNIYNLIPILTIISYLFTIIKKNILTPFSNGQNILLIIYYIVYAILTLYLYIRYTKEIKTDKIIFFYLLGMISNIIMMVSPTWGYRTSLSTYIFLTIPMIMIIDKLYKPLKNKLDFKFLATITTGIVFFYLSLYVSVNMQYKENKKIIEDAIENNKEVIEVKEYPSFANSNINPTNEYHIEAFKKYYKINNNQTIKIIPNNWKYFIFYND